MTIASALPAPSPMPCPYPVATQPPQRQLRALPRKRLRRLPVPERPVDAVRQRRGRTANLAGLCAEDAVARRYVEDGATILDRRVSAGGGELDLVALDGDVLVFVEVKRRKHALAEDPVTPAQWKRLEAAATDYILRDAEKTGTMRRARFDVALVDAESRIRLARHARPGEQD